MIRKLTILRTRVRAEVQVGENEFGGAVVVTVELPRNAEQVQDATASLENLLLRTAREHVKTSAHRQLIANEVRTAVDKRMEGERARAQRNAAAEWERQRKQLERERDEATRARAQWETRATRDAEQAERLRVRVNELDAQLREASNTKGEQVNG